MLHKMRPNTHITQTKVHKRRFDIGSPVAKAKHLLLAVLDALNELGDVVSCTNTLKHAQHCLIGSSMQRTIQRSNSTCITACFQSAGNGMHVVS